jgi:hypothetical protein
MRCRCKACERGLNQREAALKIPSPEELAKKNTVRLEGKIEQELTHVLNALDFFDGSAELRVEASSNALIRQEAMRRLRMAGWGVILRESTARQVEGQVYYNIFRPGPPGGGDVK